MHPTQLKVPPFKVVCWCVLFPVKPVVPSWHENPYEDDSGNIHIESHGSWELSRGRLGLSLTSALPLLFTSTTCSWFKPADSFELDHDSNTHPVDRDDDDNDILHMQSWCQLGLTKL
jgi:hypothetical protein